MIGKKLKQKLCMAGALGMAVLSLGISPVRAENDTAAEIDPSADITGEQYYLAKDAGVVFPNWNKTPAESDSVIAIVGSGVDYTHEDLKDVMWTDDEAVSRLKDMGGGTCGYNADGITSADGMVSYDDPMDTTGTGTQAAGVIAASWNETGISGALSGVKIMAVKATTAKAAESGLSYVLAAKEAGVNVTAMHLTLNTYTAEIDDLITQLGEAGVITVVAAGDSGTSNVSTVSLAANPYVIQVGATDSEQKLWTGSNFGPLNCDVVAPGAGILTTDITKPAETDTTVSGEEPAEAAADPAEGNTPAVSNNCSYVNSTQMAAAIVTALAADMQMNNTQKLAADVLAARIIEGAVTKVEDEDKQFTCGLVSYEGAKKAVQDKDGKYTLPLVNSAEIKNGELIIEGYDFGKKKGTVSVGGTEVKGSGTVWGDTTIRIKTDEVKPGVQVVEIKRSDKQTSARKVNILGESAPDEEIPTEGLGSNLTAVTVYDGIPFAVSAPGDIETGGFQFYKYDRDDSEEPWKTHGEYEADIQDLCADEDYIYATDGRYVVRLIPDSYEEPDETSKTERWGRMVCDPAESVDLPEGASDVRISKIDDDVIVSYTLTDGEETSVQVAKAQFSETAGEPGELVPVCEIADEDHPSLRCLDVVKTDDKLYAVCVNTASGDSHGEQLTVYELTEDEEGGTSAKLPPYQEAQTREPETYLHAGAVSNGEVITVYGVADESGTVLNEYDPTDEKTFAKVLRTETIAEDNVNALNGELDSDGNLYLGGRTAGTETEEGSPFVKSIPTGSKPAPGPTAGPTSEPTAGPTSKPTAKPTAKPTEAPASKPTPAPTAPVSTVVTCQDAGFPAGWYWNESKKACVAPMTPAPTANTTGGNRTTDGTDVRPGGNITPTATPTPEPTESAEPTATPEITPTPTVTPEDIQPPMEIINTKGILWFLGIPVLMILTGLGIYLSKNRGLIPWLIAGDAIGSVVLAVLDHSIVGWILVVLNLAAVGLLALYRSGKQEEEDEEFEDE